MHFPSASDDALWDCLGALGAMGMDEGSSTADAKATRRSPAHTYVPSAGAVQAAEECRASSPSRSERSPSFHSAVSSAGSAYAYCFSSLRAASTTCCIERVVAFLGTALDKCVAEALQEEGCGSGLAEAIVYDDDAMPPQVACSKDNGCESDNEGGHCCVRCGAACDSLQSSITLLCCPCATVVGRIAALPPTAIAFYRRLLRAFPAVAEHCVHSSCVCAVACTCGRKCKVSAPTNEEGVEAPKGQTSCPCRCRCGGGSCSSPASAAMDARRTCTVSSSDDAAICSNSSSAFGRFKSSVLDAVDDMGSTSLQLLCFAEEWDDAPIAAIALLLIACGADPHRPDAGGVTPLVAAAMRGHVSVMRVLVFVGGCSPNALVRGQNAMHVASSLGVLPFVEALLALRGRAVRHSPSHPSALSEKRSFAQHKHVGMCLCGAMFPIAIDCARGYDGMAPLHSALGRMSHPLLRLLVMNGADTSAPIRPPSSPTLSPAEQCCNVSETVTISLASSESMAAHARWSPLATAVYTGQFRCVVSLLASGCDVGVAEGQSRGDSLHVYVFSRRALIDRMSSVHEGCVELPRRCLLLNTSATDAPHILKALRAEGIVERPLF